MLLLIATNVQRANGLSCKLGPAELQLPLDCKQQTVYRRCRLCGVMLRNMSGKDQA